MNARDLAILSKRLSEACSSVEFFEAIYRRVVRAPEDAMEVRGGLPLRVIFCGHDFSPSFARLILSFPRAEQCFSTVNELRFVSTRIPKESAREFHRLNPRMRIYWISSKEHLDREPASPDPALLCEDITSMDYPPLQ